MKSFSKYIAARSAIFLIFLLSVAVAAAGQTPTALQAEYRNGQTFLTWNEVAAPGVTYRIYRSAEPITNSSQLTEANRIGEAGERSSFNERLSQILNDTTTYYVIQNGAPQLTESQGLFVHTVVDGGSHYYAVTTVAGGTESFTLISGQNALAQPVGESVGAVQPVFQRTFSRFGRVYENYVHWTTNAGNAEYPAMANRPSVAFNFGLQKRGTAITHSLLISLHARGGNFVNSNGTTDANEWVLSLDDYIPNDIRNTFWYGYHENFDLSTGLGFPTSGTVPDYTVRRARWTIDWVLNTQPIDHNRVYMMGSSMGGIGSFFLSSTMPNRIAAIFTVVPKFNFAFLTDPNPANLWNAGSPERQIGDRLWSATDVNLLSSDGIPIYERLNFGVLAANMEAVSLPVMIAFNGKNDTVVGWAEKIGLYNAINGSRHGGMFFFDGRTHNQNSILREWAPQQDPNILNRFRLDQSYPAFSNSTANGNPGNGAAADGDAFGTINGNLDWDQNTIIDTANLYQITVKTISLNSTNGTIPAPQSASVSITPRRLQNFHPAVGQTLNFENRGPDGVPIQQGQVTVDSLGLITVNGFTVTPGGNTLVLTPLTSQSPVLNSVQFFRRNSPVTRPVIGDTTKRYTVHVAGSGFSEGAVILVNDVEVKTEVGSGGELIGNLPAGRVPSIGNLRVRVRNANGMTSEEAIF